MQRCTQLVFYDKDHVCRTELIAVLYMNDLEPMSDHNDGTVVDFSSSHLTKAMHQARSVRQDLVAKVPIYMIPSIWLPVYYLPELSSTKLDRQNIKTWLKTEDLSSV
jgi:hypothetical protein